APVREIMRVIRAFDFAGSVGTYRAVAQIWGCADTFTPTAGSAPVEGAVGTRLPEGPRAAGHGQAAPGPSRPKPRHGGV
ncbi:MAG TPA: hypothetical protein VGI96_10435, partial [Streptosporangiaceae bacterium]